MKFWPQDWEGDVALRVVSLAAQGMWMRLICAMHRSDPYGHLTMNGQPMTVRQIASLASISEREAKKLLDELENSGVLSRTADGVIFSRRMVRDRAVSEAGRENGKSGGNPTLKAKEPEPIRGGVNPPLKGGPNLLEAEAETEKKDVPSERPPDAVASPAVATPPDARTVLWTEGLARLRRITGKPDRPARALLGQLCRAGADDCAMISGLLHEAETGRVGDPVPWLQAAIRTRTGARATTKPPSALGQWAALMNPEPPAFDFEGQAEELMN